jgi:hypothetical protein
MSISKGLHMWLNKLQSMKAHNDAGAVETGRSGDHGHAKQLPPAVSPGMRQSPPLASRPAANPSGITAPGVTPRDSAALGAPHQGSRSPGASAFTAGAPEPSGPGQPIRQPAWPGRAALPMAREALLANAALINDQRHDRGAVAVPKTG